MANSNRWKHWVRSIGTGLGGVIGAVAGGGWNFGVGAVPGFLAGVSVASSIMGAALPDESIWDKNVSVASTDPYAIGTSVGQRQNRIGKTGSWKDPNSTYDTISGVVGLAAGALGATGVGSGISLAGNGASGASNIANVAGTTASHWSMGTGAVENAPKMAGMLSGISQPTNIVMEGANVAGTVGEVTPMVDQVANIATKTAPFVKTAKSELNTLLKKPSTYKDLLSTVQKIPSITDNTKKTGFNSNVDLNVTPESMNAAYQKPAVLNVPQGIQQTNSLFKNNFSPISLPGYTGFQNKKADQGMNALLEYYSNMYNIK